ncbi:tRNA1(Val) (adenine(37)-N6)-methyltransferase [Aurantimonas sp. VKM B-3413]|uniref:tRNA1(Val) (adenine(37)-N6)-methyltransferase n=1 Tax=Aurantimonas sp. VKM B-3413 TaxID=2779401 RepID=UPI001E3104D0|nr:methyltransferase [Aurantimonas sp. VKM B-3413]MCB8838765.1 methyltransferase [Aurantimonas sp. VKM B-3413]
MQDRPEYREDAFYRGRFHVLQPLRHGYRSGLDALLLAATLRPDATGTLVDLGAGAGVVGLAAACRSAGVTVTLVEKNAAMAELARRNLALGENAALSGRLTVLQADLLAPRPEREAAGLLGERFQRVLTNPPFHAPGGRLPADPLRAEALFSSDTDSLPRWLKAAAGLLAPSGRLTCILRADALSLALAGVEGRLGAVRVMPIHPRPGAAATRILLHGRKGSRAPLELLPGRCLHREDGSLDPFAEKVAAGEETIDLDR